MADAEHKGNKEKDTTMSARMAAAAVLGRFDVQKRDVESIFEAVIGKTLQRQRATDLVYGTIRNRCAIDLVITAAGECPVKRISGKIVSIIRIGVYELVWCPQTPVYSIVNEAVETAKKNGGRKQAAFVNAVLRKIASHIKGRQSPLAEQTAKKTFPQDTERGCEFDMDILPDEQGDFSGYLSRAFSLPQWLVGDWVERFGKKQTKQICFACNRRPSVYLRANILRTTAGDLAAKLAEAGTDVQVIDDYFIRVCSPGRIAALAGFAEGLFTVQDLSASIPVKLLQPQQGWKILDLCAAPGTKTTQLAELAEGRAKIFATDIDDSRVGLIEENIERLKLKGVAVFRYDKLEEIVDKTGLFDYVIADVPCSNTGVLAKRVEVRLRISRQAVGGLSKKQFGILEKAAGLVKRGGKVCYSTCSIQGEEDGLLIKDFLKANGEFVLESEKLTLPSPFFPDSDGSYAAILKKK
jgi:16S rRNA (cytosine967-C5)-methyltransferase